MALTYGFYNYMEGDAVPREYDAEQFGQIFDGIITDGVYENYRDHLQVVESVNDNEVIVKPGRAWFNGTWTLVDADYAVAAPAPHPTYQRYDALVIDIDKRVDTRENKIIWVSGTAVASGVSKPVLINEDDHYQHPLCFVLRKANTPTIVQGDIENAIGVHDLCKFVRCPLDSVSAQSLVIQWDREFSAWETATKEDFEAWMNETKSSHANWQTEERADFLSWFNSMRVNIDDNVATDLYNKYNTLIRHIDKVVTLQTGGITTVTFNSNLITADSFLEVAGSVPMLQYTNITASTGTCTVTYPAYVLSGDETTAPTFTCRLYIR